MKSRKPMLVRMLDAVQGRFRRARPGSVLIMVVSLLVLLALIGTAAMSTSRLDRSSSLQNVKNVQVDLIAEGVKQMVLGVLTKDANAGNSVDSTVLSADAQVVDEANALIASLLPERRLTRQMNSSDPDFWTSSGRKPPTADQLGFQSVSYPPVQTGIQRMGAGGALISPYKIDVPTEDSSNAVHYGLPVPKPAMVPVIFTAPDGTQYPGLQAARPDGNPMLQFPNRNGNQSGQPARIGERPFMAADTDGDGVADALLVKLPITPINGITYYAAVRVVDNAAKINLNTAASPNAETAPVKVRVATANWNTPSTWEPRTLSFAGVYPASVMLNDYLDQNAADTDTSSDASTLKEFDKYNGQRVYGNRLWGPGAVPSVVPYNHDQNQNQRNDFVFLTVGDSLHNQLGRRLDNPSYSVGPNSLYGNGIRPFGIADAMALAYRFTLLNPVSQDSIVEKTLFMATMTSRDSTGKVVPGRRTPYPLMIDPTTPGWALWFYENFDFPWMVPPGQQIPSDQTGWNASKRPTMRTLLTSSNPVSNAVPKSYVPSGLYRFAYVSAYTVNSAAPVPSAPDVYNPPVIPDGTNAATRQPLKAKEVRYPDPTFFPSKANVNTAPFEELWQRFFDAMCQDAQSTPFDAGAEAAIYDGSRFLSNSPTFDITGGENAARMFRSPLRPLVPAAGSQGIPRMHPFQVLALRAAIAAANVIAMRTDNDPTNASIINDRNIPFFEIILPQVSSLNDHTQYPQQYASQGGPGTHPNFYAGVGATVYGVKRQPFITEVFLDNNTVTTSVPTTNPDGTPGPPTNLQNQSGFAAVELHNPYDKPLRISGWKLGLVDRSATAVDWLNQRDTIPNYKKPPELNVVDLPANSPDVSWTPTTTGGTPPAPFIFDDTAVIPPHGFIVLTNLAPTGTTADLDTAQYSPANTKVDLVPFAADNYVDKGARVIYVKKLHWMMGHELQLFRPVERQFSGVGNLVVRWAPVDSFDATGIPHQAFVSGGTGQTSANAWHYVRSNDPSNPAGSRAWHFVYPGRYQAIDDPTDATSVIHHQGVEQATWNPQTDAYPWLTGPPTASAFGAPDLHNSRDAGKDYPDPALKAATFPIQIANGDFGTQFVTPGNQAAFPLNGFMRLGDLLQVTYIGSYTIWDADATWTASASPPWTDPVEGWAKPGAGPTSGKAAPTVPLLAGGGGRFIEINPVSMDAAFAEDTDTSDDFLVPNPAASPLPPVLPLEDIGRFAPINFDRGSYTNPPSDLTAPKYEDGQFTGQAVADKFKVDGTWLQTMFPQDYWVGSECYIYNSDQSDTSPWKVQVRYVTGWDKVSGTITLNAPLSPQITAPPPPPAPQPIYRFKLKRVRYGWASKLFDYFTVNNSPAEDYLPNVDPSLYDPILPNFPEFVKNISDPSRQPNRTALPTEDDVPAEGLVNINTANWKTIAQLPLVMVMTGPTAGRQVDPAATEHLARNIVYFRDVDDGFGTDPGNIATFPRPPHPHGPFKSIYELCMVPGFLTAMNTIPTTATLADNPGYNFGDFSPLNGDGDRVRWDFKEKYLTLTRISNLVTTKSDSFTAYLQVQGWRDAGTADAKLVVQKRLSFIIDRSKVTTSAKAAPTVYNVPVAE